MKENTSMYYINFFAFASSKLTVSIMFIRIFKKWVNYAASVNLLNYLFNKNQIQQSLWLILTKTQRLELNQDCFKNDYIVMLKHYYFSLYNHYISLYEHVMKTSANSSLINTHIYATDERHTEIHT